MKDFFTKEELDARQLNHLNESLFNNLPTCEEVIVVIYASYNDMFIFDSDGLDEIEKTALVFSLMREMQGGTVLTRKIAKKIENCYFIY